MAAPKPAAENWSSVAEESATPAATGSSDRSAVKRHSQALTVWLKETVTNFRERLVKKKPSAWQQIKGKSTPLSRRLSGGSTACFFAPSSAAGLERASQARAGTTTVPASADMAKWKKVTVTVKPLPCCSTRLVRVSLIRLSDTQAANSAPTSSTARARCFGACSSLLPESATAIRTLAR
eukprot:scaffold18072_cov70-Phaeocystis_antarctica.AAC.1